MFEAEQQLGEQVACTGELGHNPIEDENRSTHKGIQHSHLFATNGLDVGVSKALEDAAVFDTNLGTVFPG